MKLGLAFNVFFKVLGNSAFAEKLSDWLDKPSLPASKPAPAKTKQRTEAIELLAALQRDGRLIDFLKENLDGYSDAQVGAAVRDIHRDCAKTLDRMFGITGLVSQPEGSEIALPEEIDPGMWKLTGKVGEGTAKGRLCHHGWIISRHEVPSWTGRDDSAWVIAPAEVEIA